MPYKPVGVDENGRFPQCVEDSIVERMESEATGIDSVFSGALNAAFSSPPHRAT